MNPTKSVLGVLGMCWVSFRNPTQFLAFYFAALRLLCWVCWVWRRARACASFFSIRELMALIFFSHARPVKPNTPNTLNTHSLKLLNLKGFRCVGFVLGWVIFVLGLILSGGAGR